MSKNPRTKERDQEELAEQPEGSTSKSQNQEAATLPDDKQGRLLSLAKKLQQIFPEQSEELAQVIERVEKGKVGSRKTVECEQGLFRSRPIARAASGGSTIDQEEEEEIDPRGPAPEQKDPLIHIFVDHSNILYGLPQPKPATPYRERSNTLPRSRVNSVTAPTPVATGTRPLPISTTSPKDKIQFLSLSSPTTSPLMARLRMAPDLSREVDPETSANSDGLGVGDTDPRQKKKKPQRRLWYAAFILVLERGRPVTRRVAVASRKPVTLPMETLPIGAIQRFGYEVRVLVRVPDSTGDGLDHEQSKGKSSPSSPKFHAKGMSRSTSSESSSGRNAASSSPKPNYGTIHLGTPPNKVKYREQGVDELLQLKLYQAITDPEPDNIPDGSTIVLATGDGAPGQFGEQGFLGPIKTALRGGWNVELYAWEDSLSRAWEREFAEEIKSGKFRIIGIQQFAKWLSYD